MYIVYLLVLTFSFLYVRLNFTPGSNRFLIFIWFFLFVMLGTYAYFTDDYEPYIDTIEEAYSNVFAHIHIEPFWIWLADYVHGNVDLFRFYAFIFISILLLLIAKSARIELKYFIIYYTIFCLSTHLCWIRQPLGMCFYLWGLLLLCNKKYLIGISCLVLSCFIHKSIIMFLGVLPFCILPINKKSIGIYILSMPLLYACFYILLNSSSTNSSLLILQEYAQKEGEYAERNIVFEILSLCTTLLQFSLLIYTVYRFHRSEDRQVVFLARYLLAIFFISIFLFLLPLETNVIYKRLLSFAMLLLVIIWTKCVKGKFFQRAYIYLCILVFLSVSVREIGLIGNNYTRTERLTRFP